MKKKFLLLCSICLLCVFCLFGCGISALSSGPKADDTVYGNGGFAVIKGDYIYFANAYYDYNNLSDKDNKYDFNSAQKLYGIYRAKLNGNGTVDLDENGFPVGAELMVPQVAGYSYSGLYICGNYLYYTTPYSGNDNGNIVKGLVSFERVNLDRTGHKVIYKMDKYSADCKYFINYIDNATYITILDTESNVKLLKIVGENIQERTVATEVADVIAFSQSTLTNNNVESGVNNYIFYTKKDSNEYYSLFKKSLVNLDEGAKTLVPSTKNALELVEIKNDRVYFKENNILKSSTFSGDEAKIYTNFEINSENTEGIVDYYILDDSFGTSIDKGILGVFYDGDTYSVSIFNGGESQTFLFSNSEQINVLFAYNNNVYYQIVSSGDESDNNLYCYNKKSNESSVVVNNFVTKVSDDEANVFEFDFSHAYFFASVESSNNTVLYLHMVGLDGIGYEDDSEAIGHYIGLIDASKAK